MSCKLIIDNRERNVTRHMVEFANTPHETHQLTVGDYAVLDAAGRILAVIERKSLDDFAASMKDGRADNKNKLFALRRRTGCRVLYIIEGPHASPDKLFGRTPYSHIESSVFHLMMRDDVGVIRTLNTLETAQTLARFVRSMDTLVAKHNVDDFLPEPANDSPADRPQDVADTVGGADSHGAAQIGGADMPVHAADDATGDSLAALKAPVPVDDNAVVRKMWSVIRGISVESADDYAKSFTLGQVARGKLTPEVMTTFKLSSGRRPSKGVLARLAAPDPGIQERLLEAIPGVSRKTAQDLLCGRTLADLLDMSQDSIADIKVGQTKRRFGPQKASAVAKYFNAKLVPVAFVPVAASQ